VQKHLNAYVNSRKFNFRVLSLNPRWKVMGVEGKLQEKRRKTGMGYGKN
jgi:hypothetical protein